MAMTCVYRPDGILLHIKAKGREGVFLQTLDGDGNAIRTYDMAGPGWAGLGPSIDNKTVFIDNFFTGKIIKLDLDSGETVAEADTKVERALAGIAQYPG